MKSPTGWGHTTFDKHVDCLTGFAFKSSGYSNDEKDIRLLRGDNIEPGNLRWRDAKYWSDIEVKNLERYHDVLLYIKKPASTTARKTSNNQVKNNTKYIHP